MTESITITVHPAVSGDGTLTVADAMRQVLDAIDLIEKAAPVDEAARVVWRLARASTNSPFTVVAESRSDDPSVSVALLASEQATRFRSGVRELIEQGTRPTWMDAAALTTAKRLFDRNLNGIGQTDFTFAAGDSIFITHPDAQRASLHVEQVVIRERISVEDLTRIEQGAVEGHIVAATTHYGRPALILKERLSGDRVTCVLTNDLADRLGFNSRLNDVWQGRRVSVSGVVAFGADGGITKIEADDLEHIKEDMVDLNEIRALGLAGGLRPRDYLARRGDDDLA